MLSSVLDTDTPFVHAGINRVSAPCRCWPHQLLQQPLLHCQRLPSGPSDSCDKCWHRSVLPWQSHLDTWAFTKIVCEVLLLCAQNASLFLISAAPTSAVLMIRLQMQCRQSNADHAIQSSVLLGFVLHNPVMKVKGKEPQPCGLYSTSSRSLRHCTGSGHKDITTLIYETRVIKLLCTLVV